MSKNRIFNQQSGRSDVFWGEMAPCEHLLQIYAEDGVFLDSLEGFVAGGLKAGEAVIVIATPNHLAALNDQLIADGISLSIARASDQYIPLDAEATMSTFLVDGWPDEFLFEQSVIRILTRARRSGRRVRAFGEMVAVMWGQGLNGATVRLEHLWHAFCRKEEFSLFCAYPRSGFTENAEQSIREICETHSKVLSG